MNQTTSAQEVSAEMAAAALLGMSSEVCTHGFITFHVSAAIGYALQNPISTPAQVDEFRDIDTEENENDEIHINPSETNAPSSPLSIHSDVEDITNPMPVDQEEEPYMLDLPQVSVPEDTADIFAPVGVYQMPNKVAAVSDHENYAFRGPHLSHFSLYQWRSINEEKTPHKRKRARAVDDELQEFRKEVESQEETAENEPDTTPPIISTEDNIGGRPDNGCFDFDPQHVLYTTHYQQLRSK